MGKDERLWGPSPPLSSTGRSSNGYGQWFWSPKLASCYSKEATRASGILQGGNDAEYGQGGRKMSQGNKPEQRETQGLLNAKQTSTNGITSTARVQSPSSGGEKDHGGKTGGVRDAEEGRMGLPVQSGTVFHIQKKGGTKRNKMQGHRPLTGT